MSIVDLSKARAWAEAVCEDEAARSWIEELADEVESLERSLNASRATSQAALSEAARLAAENESMRTALADICAQLARLIKESS